VEAESESESEDEPPKGSPGDTANRRRSKPINFGTETLMRGLKVMGKFVFR
jgi:hypothetical protein